MIYDQMRFTIIKIQARRIEVPKWDGTTVVGRHPFTPAKSNQLNPINTDTEGGNRKCLY